VVVVVVVVIGKDLLCRYDFYVKFVAYKPRHWLSLRFCVLFFYYSQHFVLHFDTVRKCPPYTISFPLFRCLISDGCDSNCFFFFTFSNKGP